MKYPTTDPAINARRSLAAFLDEALAAGERPVVEVDTEDTYRRLVGAGVSMEQSRERVTAGDIARRARRGGPVDGAAVIVAEARFLGRPVLGRWVIWRRPLSLVTSWEYDVKEVRAP